MQVFKRQWFPLILLAVSAGIAILLSEYWYKNFDFALADGLINALPFSLSVWTAGFITRNYPTHVAAIIYSLIIGSIAGYISFSLSSLLSQWWWRGSSVFVHLDDATTFTRLLLHVLGACWIISMGAMRKRSDEMEEKIERVADAATLHKEAELFKLRQQIQPHFLYNSLNSINALITIMPDEAQVMIGKLSDFLRSSVKRDTQKEIPLQEELEYIENYLAIESIRFGDRLKVTIEKSFGNEITIPPFLLQPILENAIKFGVYGKTGIVEILIDIRQEHSLLRVQVQNPFDETMKPLSGTGFGLEGISRRLFLLYGRTDLLETQKENNIFTTRIKIPQPHVQSPID
ncbi:MAG TPA: histidine kinase [Flavipsychrobacter sp.]|nr:histidine kinase [Flavipsychrobacter sp.]